MKKITCKQLGGPCDHEFSSLTREEISIEFTQHVMETQDVEHRKIADKLKSMSEDEVVNWKSIVIEKWNTIQSEKTFN